MSEMVSTQLVFFAGEYGIDQLFDYVMMTSTLKGLPYDASWGTANASTRPSVYKEYDGGQTFCIKVFRRFKLSACFMPL